MAAAGAANASKQFVTTSLYIGDLDPEVDENLYDLFDQVGQVVSMTVNTIDSGTKVFYFWPCVRMMIAPQIHHLFLLTIIRAEILVALIRKGAIRTARYLTSSRDIKGYNTLIQSIKTEFKDCGFAFFKNPSSLALCPTTKNCISTYKNITHAIHYASPWLIFMSGKLYGMQR
ncbi:hypothetical protein AHAS_Ahas09G0013300 [Arachis hypogaea]